MVRRLTAVEIVCVGEELLDGSVVNTNAVYLGSRLHELGFRVRAVHTVGDRVEEIDETIRQSLSRVKVVIVTGGLGPTGDDLTREAVCSALGLSLQFRPQLWDSTRQLYCRRGGIPQEEDLRQARLPQGASPLPNSVGTAPGFWLRWQQKLLICLPGPPHELRTMWTEHAEKVLLSQLPGERPRPAPTMTLRVCGMGEAQVQHRISQISLTGVEVGIYSFPGEIQVRLTATQPGPRGQEQLARAEANLRAALGDHVFGVDEQTLPAALGARLVQRQLTLATAESVTGGRVADLIVSAPGASRYFLGGVVAYDQETKRCLLGVGPDLLERYGPVSPEVSEAMARGVARLLGADVSLALTGLAGPGREEDGRPVGTVYACLLGPWGTKLRERWYPGPRELVRQRAAMESLAWLYLTLQRLT